MLQSRGKVFILSVKKKVIKINPQNFENKYIYKITNLINNKAYIGQTINIKNRFMQHCLPIKNKVSQVSLIKLAINKYGKENFIVEELYFGPDYSEKEKEFIKFYNTLTPNGYNLQEGGEEPPLIVGEDNFNSKLTLEEVEEIYELLKQGKRTKDIQGKYNVTTGQLNRINNGEAWFNKDLDYPLNKNNNDSIPDEAILNIIKDIKENKLTLKEIGNKNGVSKSAVVLINQGRTDNVKKVYNGNFPIRAIPLGSPSEEDIKKFAEIIKNSPLSLKKIAETYNKSISFVQNVNYGQTNKVKEVLKNEDFPLRKNKN